MTETSCSFSGRCSGCSYWGIAHSTQLRRKADYFRQAWDELDLGSLPPINMIAPADRGLRDRLDFQWRDGNFGLMDRNRVEIVDLSECLQLSPSLHAWLEDFRRVKWPVKGASFRLRVSPSGDRGVWLDMSHVDVKNLFDEEKILRELLEMATVEVGQRRKRLVVDDGGRLRLLKEPQFAQWTRTWQGQTAVPLMSRIADFSQPGDLINQILVGEVIRDAEPCRVAIDWGCGGGNFTFPLTVLADQVFAFDSDAMTLLGLQKSVEMAGLSAASEVAGVGSATPQIIVARVDFNDLDEWGPAASTAVSDGGPQSGACSDLHGVRAPAKSKVPTSQPILREAFETATTWLVDPPRSGAGSLFAHVPSQLDQVISVSCFAESFMQDASQLQLHGFKCVSLTMLDQFPQTPHAEWISRWLR